MENFSQQDLKWFETLKVDIETNQIPATEAVKNSSQIKNATAQKVPKDKWRRKSNKNSESQKTLRIRIFNDSKKSKAKTTTIRGGVFWRGLWQKLEEKFRKQEKGLERNLCFTGYKNGTTD